MIHPPPIRRAPARPPILLLPAALCAWSAAVAPAAELLRIDFEKIPSPPRHERLDFGKMNAAIVPAGDAGRGLCLELRNPEPATSCTVVLKGPIPVEKNLALSFDHRETVEAGFGGAYLGVSVAVSGKQEFWTSDTFSPSWRHADIGLARLRDSAGRRIEPGTVISSIRLYARVKETTPVRDATKALMTAWFDNLRLHTDPPPPVAADAPPRESFSNPPLLIWPPEPGASRQTLQLSQDPAFPPAKTQTLEAQWNFHTPAAPLEPGAWHWRVRIDLPLSDAWSKSETLVIAPDAHRFTTRPIPNLEITPRPRLLPLARIGQPEVTDARRAQLRKLADSIRRRGVPDHPGPHVPGDPRWPTWIDWYGQVAGSITGGTGRRLQSIAQYAMLGGDTNVVAWTRHLALEAAKWDPEGGSAMSRGDIGAHHLLRGLSWCYDACRDAMTPAERDTLRDVIVRRAGQFWKSLNPYRSNEANNHSWLQALALGEAGIVLAGDHPEAAAWAEYVRQLYLGRFLCCLGHQGENNEGIAYWAYGLGFIIDYGDLLRSVCGIDIFQHPWLKQTARFPMYCAPPNAWAVSFADTGMPNHGTRGPAETRQVRDLATRTRDPFALWYSGAREPVDGLAPQSPASLPASLHYRDIGVVIFNTSLVDGNEGATVALHSGRYWAGHQHPDQNHFVIHAYGEKLAIDGGYYDWYGSPHFKAYSMNTLSHNTLLVDGRGQAACCAGADGRIKAFHDSPGYGYAVGDASNPRIYGGLLREFDRRILFIKPGFTLVHDLVASAGGAADYDWLLHAIAPVHVDVAAGSFLISRTNAALRGSFLLPKDLALDVKTGFPAEPVNRYSTNPVPKENYFPEWTIHARPRNPGPTAEFLAAMQIQRLGAAPEPPAEITPVDSPGARAVRIRCGERTHVALFRARDFLGPLEAAGLSTDGEAAAIALEPDGKPLRALAVRATFLDYKGTHLFKAAKPADWAADLTAQQTPAR